MAAFDAMGLRERVSSRGSSAGAPPLVDPSGRQLGAIRTSDIVRRYGYEYVVIYRQVLNKALAEGLEDSIRLNARFVRFDEDKDGVTAHFDDGSMERGALLVGADGVWSTVRTQLFPEAQGQTEDQVVWRAVRPAADFALGEQAFVIGRDSTRGGWMHTGNGLVYWAVAQLGADIEAPADIKAEALTLADNLYDGGWDFPIRELIEATPADEILRDPVSEAPWLETWVSDRVALVGDAAHAMSPHTGSGGSFGIEDAMVLVQHLEKAGVADALAAYDTERRARLAWVRDRAELVRKELGGGKDYGEVMEAFMVGTVERGPWAQART
jgi:2-polyprenyl-6-methoxyphenol hydroxylase-like FAD-dependent oxidoreductase